MILISILVKKSKGQQAKLKIFKSLKRPHTHSNA